MPALPCRRPVALFAGVALALAAPVSSSAEDDALDRVRAQAGTWLVAPDDGQPGCRVTLEVEPKPAGRVARAAPDCGARIANLRELATWSFAEGGVSLNDAAGRRLMLFREGEGGVLKTPGDGVPNHLMVQARPGVDRAPHAPAIFGTWTMQRPGGAAICTATFRDRPPAGGEESFALDLDPGCDPAVRKLKLVAWRVEEFALVLYGTEGASLRFEPLPGGAFTKDMAEGGLPLRLLRRK